MQFLVISHMQCMLLHHMMSGTTYVQCMLIQWLFLKEGFYPHVLPFSRLTNIVTVSSCSDIL